MASLTAGLCRPLGRSVIEHLPWAQGFAREPAFDGLHREARMDEIKGIARVRFHPGKVEEWKMKEQLGKGGPKLFTPWMALQDQEVARED